LNENGIGFSKFLKFTSYLSVDIIAVILPIALGISAAFVFQRFNESNQLTALQSAGVSPRKMLIPLTRMAALAIAYLYASNAFLSPYAWREFRSFEFKIRNNVDPPEKAGAIFSNDGFSVYAKKYVGNFFFGDLYVIDSRNPEKTYSYFAKIGTIRNNALSLIEGERIEIDFTSKKNSIMRFKSYNCDLKEILKAERKAAQPNEKFINELYKDKSDPAERALFHQKITSPLLAGIFCAFSYLLILLAPYSRKRSNWRMIFLSALIMCFQGSYLWIANAAVRNPDFIKLNYILIFASIIILAALIARDRKS
jgi:lipopolysaccharide export LptBFGC system permease protein LptF